MPTAVVTGAAGGIGAAICDVLGARAWNVVPVDCVAVDRPGALLLDLRDVDATLTALRALPRVDALVNNAARQLFKPLLEISADEWDDVMATNLRGAFVCLQAVADALRAAEGSVVNVASVHAVATSSGNAAYAASKGGLVAFTRSAALEMAEHGVRVNAVVPGAVATHALLSGSGRAHDARDMLVARTPLSRIGEPSEIAALVAFLIDRTSSGFITGQTFVADGGVLARLASE